MNTIVDSKIMQKSHLIMAVIAIVVFAFAGLAVAMQEYEDLKVLADPWSVNLPRWDFAGEALTCTDRVNLSQEGVCWPASGTGGSVMMWAHTNPFADDVLEAAGTRVRKQMQKIKQAAQLVRNQILEIRCTIETSGLDEGEEGYMGVLSADGTVKWFLGKKGYGFIVPDEGGNNVLMFDCVSTLLALINQETLYFVLETEGEFQVLSSTLSITIFLTPEEQMQAVIEELEQIIDANPDTPLADKAEDARNKAVIARYELTKTPPDKQAAVGNIEGAVGDVEAAVNDGLLDFDQGLGLMDVLTYVAWQLAVDAIDAAVAAEADPDKITEAEQALAEGDELWIAGAYKDAVNKYKDALAKAEALAKAVVQDLETEDGELLGTAGLYYNKTNDTTVVQVDCWALEANAECIVVLFESDQDGNVTDYIELGSFTTNENGNAYLQGRVDGDVSDWCVVVGVVDGNILHPCGSGLDAGDALMGIGAWWVNPENEPPIRL